MLDAVQFEELGIPSAAIITAPFRTTCVAMAELQGFADYPMAVVPHPITSLTPEQVLERADRATRYVEALLVDGVPWPDEEVVTAVKSHSLLDVVEELAPGLRTDGADLFVEQSGDHTAVFRLHIPDQACADCIMPSRILLPMFSARVASMMGPGWTVTLDDPRDDAAHLLHRTV